MSDEEYEMVPLDISNYPAVDGVAKKDRNHRWSDLNEATLYDPAQKGIRPDVEKILSMVDNEFDWWYEARKTATTKLIESYKLFASIPDLGYGTGEHIMTSQTHVQTHLDTLEKGLEYLEVIKKARDERQSK
jgi:hypothetical protein